MGFYPAPEPGLRFVSAYVSRKPHEAFGDYTARLGFPTIKEFQAGYALSNPAPAPVALAPAANGNGSAASSVSLDPATLKALESAAKAQGKTLDQFLSDAAKQPVK